MIKEKNYRGHTLGIAFGTLLAVLLLAGGAGAAVWTVDDSDGADYSSIQEAINNANPGDTILVYNGTYTENVNVSKQLILRGVDDGDGMPVVDGQGGNGFMLNANGITIEGFVITNANYGIYLESYNNNIIENNTLNQNDYGIYALPYSDSGDIGDIYRGNIITPSYNGYGIYMENYLYDSSYGDIYNITIEDNTITSSSSSYNDGIYLYAYSNIYDISIKNNTISDALDGYGGIVLDNYESYSIYDITIQGNTIGNSYYGIYFYFSDSNNLTDNTASSNNYGIYLASSSSNTIYNNYFNNTDNVYDDGTNTWNTTQTLGTNIVGGPYLGGNFWASPDGNGFSQTCTPNIDGICYETFNITFEGSIDYLPLAVSTPSFVTDNPIRALTRSGAATRIPTNVYFYYNGSTININVSLNQPDLIVSGDFSNVDNDSSISTSTSYQNGSDEEYIYTLTATAGNVDIGVQSVTITATNTLTGATNANVFIALMNINPLVFEPTLGGTDWTEIEDFTNVTLTFEKYTDSSHNVKLGTLEFLEPMNLVNQTTATALISLGENLQMAQDSMSLNSAADALAAMNVSSRLSMYNLTDFTNSPGILMDGIPVVAPGLTSGGPVSSLSWNSTNHSLVFQVSHWTKYSVDGQLTTTTTSGSSGGRGGGGVVTNESFENIEQYEGQFGDLGANTSEVFWFKSEGLGVYEVLVYGTQTQNDVMLKIEKLKGLSGNVPKPPPGTVYMYLNIYLGTKRFDGSLIKFKIDNEWLKNNGLDASDIKLVKFDGTEWIILETTVTGTDDQWTYVEAESKSFSPFAIVGIKGGQATQVSTPAPTPRAQVTADTTEVPEPVATKKAPGFGSGFAIAAIAIAMIGAAYLRRKKDL